MSSSPLGLLKHFSKHKMFSDGLLVIGNLQRAIFQKRSTKEIPRRSSIYWISLEGLPHLENYEQFFLPQNCLSPIFSFFFQTTVSLLMAGQIANRFFCCCHFLFFVVVFFFLSPLCLVTRCLCFYIFWFIWIGFINF